MAKRSGLANAAFVGGYDLSSDISAVDRIGGGPAALEQTAIDKSAYERIGGLRAGEISFTTWFDDQTEAAAVNLTSSSVADPTLITAAAVHGLDTGDVVVISGHTGSTPDINGIYTVIVLSTTTFTIPIAVTVGGGATGTCTRMGGEHEALSALPMTDVHMMYCLGTTLGYPAACMVAKQLNYDGSRGADGSLSFSAANQSNGYGLEWCKLLTAGLRTDIAATAGTGVDGGAQAAAVNITSSSVANPTVITTATAHGLTSGDGIVIAGHTGSTPDINNAYIVTVLTATTYTIPVNVTVGGTGGTMTLITTRFGLSAYLQVVFFSGTNVTIKIQESLDDGVTDAYADVTGGGFTQVIASPTTERIITGLTLVVERYLRVTTTTVGGVTAVVFAVAYNRFLTTPAF